MNALVAIDLSAAFDTVDHAILLEVMEKQFGITSEAKLWFSSYLYPRGFKVKIKESYSSRKDLPFSVPQGSILGPTLFNIYASTLAETIPDDISLNGFADDHSLQHQFEPGTRRGELLLICYKQP